MESYLETAWNNFFALITFMRNTTILTIRGVNVTFMGLLIAIVVFDIILWALWELLDIATDFI